MNVNSYLLTHEALVGYYMYILYMYFLQLESLAHSYWPIVFCIIDPLHHTYYGWYTAWGVIWRHAIDSLS